MAVDASGNNLYGFEFRYIYRFPINQSNKCPSTGYASRIRTNANYVFGADTHPSDDKILYINNYYSHRVEKITLNNSLNSIQSTSTAGRCCTGKSSSSNIRMYYPWGLSVDKLSLIHI